jgi:hypothetical protein
LAVARQFLDVITANGLPFPMVYTTGVDLACFKGRFQTVSATTL